jgi:hypothetical protein
MAVAAFSVPPQIFYSRALFLVFIAVPCVASYVSYHRLAIPLQRLIRKRCASAGLYRLAG